MKHVDNTVLIIVVTFRVR